MGTNSRYRLPSPWHEVLGRAGFQPGEESYRNSGLSFRSDASWLSLCDTNAQPPRDRLRESLDALGLWKWIKWDGCLRRVFELPATLVQAEEQDADDDPAVCLALGAFLEWGVATASGAVPEGWHCPPQAQRESWLPASRLTVQHGSFVRQGEWLAEPDRLALQFPILPDLPADLPTARRAWLEELLLDAQDRWHPVRLGITGDERRQTVVARVDLTGAPSCPFLFLTSLEALQYVTAWMVESAELLANMQVACAALALPPKKTQRRKEQDA